MGDTFQWFASEGFSAAEVVMVVFTFVLVWMAARQDRHFRIKERAVVRFASNSVLIHKRPSERGGVMTRLVVVSLQVENCGNTPCRVTECAIELRVDPRGDLQARDDFQVIDRFDALVVQRDHLVFSMTFHPADTDVTAAWQDRATLWLTGYIDYIDSFEGRHRTTFAKTVAREGIDPDGERGYARVHELQLARLDGFNSNRRRVYGEGSDWERS